MEAEMRRLSPFNPRNQWIRQFEVVTTKPHPSPLRAVSPPRTRGGEIALSVYGKIMESSFPPRVRGGIEGGVAP